ncbi:MAG: hypothetical protein HOI95_27900 [Chromatiales bacterium]|jgi:hypothetical protein|nr:hypothetical protein [Chromatiales bacterium]
MATLTTTPIESAPSLLDGLFAALRRMARGAADKPGHKLTTVRGARLSNAMLRDIGVGPDFGRPLPQSYLQRNW